MKYVSVCSGIEAASMAWEPLGWKPVAFSEIEPFPAAVLKHHWPKVPNLGDMTKHEQWTIPSGSVDLLVGGTPCQSFSVAGLRQGLKDPRGNLMLTYLAIAERLKPRWLVWENVPGVLSSNGGKDFGSFLGALGELGYGWAYRVLDAQWFGVAQRRRRVFVVAHLGKGNLAAKVLFESESVRRDTPPSREAGQRVATDVEEGVGVSLPEREVVGCLSDGAHMGVGLTAKTRTAEESWPSQIAETLMATDHKGPGHNRDHNFITEPVVIDRAAFNQGHNAQYRPHIEHSETMDSLVARGPHAVAFQTSELRLAGKLTEQSVCPTLKANTKAGDTEVKVVLYENHPNDSRVTGPHNIAPSCVSRYGTGGGNVPFVQEGLVGQVDWRTANSDKGEVSQTLKTDLAHQSGPCVAVASKMAVRRLTPKECERLQGFPDDHTLISWRNKPADQCPDGPRYKALGNSMAVPCMAWIGKRIDAIERNNRKDGQ